VCIGKLSSKPFMPINIDLDRIRRPCRKAYMHKTKLTVDSYL
jgi:hypothetical protein